MKTPLFGHLFTNSEKGIIKHVLWTISKKDSNGQPIKTSYFNELDQLLFGNEELPALEIKIVQQTHMEIIEELIAAWPEPKKILLKGLIIDLLCYKEQLYKIEFDIVSAFYKRIEINDPAFDKAVKRLIE